MQKLTKNEAAVIQMALLIIDMITTAKSAKEKMIEITGTAITLEPMSPEDETQYVLPKN